MRLDAWSDTAAGLQGAVLAELKRGDPSLYAHIVVALQAGGRLRLSFDKPGELWRFRVRLIHKDDTPNIWIWTSFARRPPGPPLAVVPPGNR